MFSSNTAGVEGPSGQQFYTVSGTYTFTVPADVYSISVLCIGGGGGGGARANYFSPETIGGGGGGGGGLAYSNNFAVAPGDTFTVVVGAGGAGNHSPGGTFAGDSYVQKATSPNNVLAYATGGQNGRAYVSGSSDPFGGAGGYRHTGEGGATGGTGGNGNSSVNSGVTSWGGGGGGAAGYLGNGGNGGSAPSRIRNNGSDAAANGGGGGGGTSSGNTLSRIYPGNGGGVGNTGGTGSITGRGGGNWTVSGATYYGGEGGSGGGNAGNSYNNNTTLAGNYGGGGAGGAHLDAGDVADGRPGFRGAVTIIWGSGRSFPANY